MKEFSGSALAGWDCGDKWYSPFCEAGERIIGGIGSGSNGGGTANNPPVPPPVNYTPVILGGVAVLALAVLIGSRK